jgi:CO/xanthine dehydrogenase Mo-binding subunit
VLRHGELITAVELPNTAFFSRSHYLKVRDRESFEFALASVAAALEVKGGKITAARLALGGVATKPWRAAEAEKVLVGAEPGEAAFAAAARAALQGARPQKFNAFKIELARRAVVRALTVARAFPPTEPKNSDRGTKKPKDYERGDPDKAFADAAVRVEQTYTIPAEHHNPAVALRLDPVELRLRNHADADPQTGRPWSSKSLKECYREGAERFGWARRNPKPRSMRAGRLLVGYGMASATWPTHRRPATAQVRILADGTAVVRTAAADIGPGTYTAMTQIAADALGLPVARVRFELGDSRLPPAPVQGGSMTVASVGSAVHDAALAARGEVLKLAIGDARSPLHRATADQVGSGAGRLFLKKEPSRGETYADILRRHRKEAVEVTHESKPGDETRKFSMHAFGAHFVEVRVDPDLGTVRVARVVGGFAAGRIINPKTAHSQAIGGIVGGLGMALLEETVWDPRNGRVVNANFADYHVPVHADIPDLEAFFVDERDPHANPLGAKGLAELSLVGVAAAVANAVYHATGKRVRDLPITPDKLL